MREESTTELLQIFKQIPDSEKESFLEEMPPTLTPGEWFNRHFSRSQVTIKDVARRCEGRITRSYIYALLAGEKKNPSRDVVLLICLAAHLNRKETRQVLELFELRDLYIKDPRDIMIAIAINRKEFNIDALNDRLHEYGLPLLEGRRDRQ